MSMPIGNPAPQPTYVAEPAQQETQNNVIELFPGDYLWSPPLDVNDPHTRPTVVDTWDPGTV
jgi:hypothetical protein